MVVAVAVDVGLSVVVVVLVVVVVTRAGRGFGRQGRNVDVDFEVGGAVASAVVLGAAAVVVIGVSAVVGGFGRLYTGTGVVGFSGAFPRSSSSGLLTNFTFAALAKYD